LGLFYASELPCFGVVLLNFARRNSPSEGRTQEKGN
jgi:hypothetical protein